MDTVPELILTHHKLSSSLASSPTFPFLAVTHSLWFHLKGAWLRGLSNIPNRLSDFIWRQPPPFPLANAASDHWPLLKGRDAVLEEIIFGQLREKRQKGGDKYIVEELSRGIMIVDGFVTSFFESY